MHRPHALALAAALTLSACASAPEPLPAELPHYPCTKTADGKTVFYACSDQEWLMQELLRKPGPARAG